METPLVTVSVITYNSSDTIIETLDSIYSQSYPRIELIVSDDCSTDDTIDICKRWLLIYGDRFESFRLLQSEKNTGVTANCNRAISGVQGEYLKLLAGDDLLVPEALVEYVNYIQNNNEAVFVFSRVEVFGDNEETVKKFRTIMFNYSFSPL